SPFIGALITSYVKSSISIGFDLLSIGLSANLPNPIPPSSKYDKSEVQMMLTDKNSCNRYLKRVQLTVWSGKSNCPSRAYVSIFAIFGKTDECISWQGLVRRIICTSVSHHLVHLMILRIYGIR
ncbi:hypothetical protein ALC60_06384, partial [Trachymyrmex zeteki]